MCNNQVSVFVQRGFDFQEISIDCGRTDPRGDLALCEKCESQREQRLTNSDEPEDIGYQDW